VPPLRAAGFELQLADQRWVAAPITKSEGATLTLSAAAVGVLKPIALRLNWRDQPCCPEFYGNDKRFNWQWWNVAQHPTEDAGICPPRNCSLYSR